MHALRFLDFKKAVEDSAFDFAELLYVLHGHDRSPDRFGLSNDEIADFMHRLRSTLGEAGEAGEERAGEISVEASVVGALSRLFGVEQDVVSALIMDKSI